MLVEFFFGAFSTFFLFSLLRKMLQKAGKRLIQPVNSVESTCLLTKIQNISRPNFGSSQKFAYKLKNVKMNQEYDNITSLTGGISEIQGGQLTPLQTPMNS